MFNNIKICNWFLFVKVNNESSYIIELKLHSSKSVLEEFYNDLNGHGMTEDI